VSYTPGPPQQLYDSTVIEIGIKPKTEPEDSTLLLELLPSRAGWSIALDTVMKRGEDGWYRASAWVCPTEPGEYTVRWQTSPFTGFTFYLAARYDSAGQLIDWDNAPVATAPELELYPRDTMEFAFYYWPHVLYRRVHLIRASEQANVYWIVTQSLYRSAGAETRSMWPSANLTFDERYPLRTRQWSHAGWVADTLLATVRADTMVATIDWSYQGIGDNWERNTTLFREWQYDRTPKIYFQLNSEGHIVWASKEKPAKRRVAAQLHTVESDVDYETAKNRFRSTPPASADTP